MSPKKSILSYIKGVTAGMPMLLDAEGGSRPEFGKLNLSDQLQYLNGILGMGGAASGMAQEQIGTARDAELSDIAGNTGAVGNILNLINPQGRTALNQASTLATDAFNRAQGPLSPMEKRNSDQQAREAFGARGRLNDNASVVGELMGREDVMARKREEAAALGNNAYSLSSQFTTPALSLLTGAPAGVSLGQDYLNSSQRIIGQNTPQLINPDAGINMGLAQQSALNSYNMASAAAGQNSAAMWGQLGTSLMGLAGNYFKKS